MQSSAQPLSHESIASPAQPMSIAERDQLLANWRSAYDTLSVAKSREMELRKRIVEETDLFDPNKQSGTQTVELGNGWKLKAVKKLNYIVANKEGEAFEKLHELSALSEVAAFKAKKLFRFDANLSITAYKDLDASERAIIDEIVTTKQASPSLELVPPKS